MQRAATEFSEVPKSLGERVAVLETFGPRLNKVEEGVSDIRKDIQRWGFRILLGIAGTAVLLLAEIALTKLGLLHPSF
jgi:hypothetical protein